MKKLWLVLGLFIGLTFNSCVKDLEIRVAQNVSVYPSPCKDVLSVSYFPQGSESLGFKLADGKGNIITEATLTPATNTISIDVSQVAAGALFATFTDGNNSYREKVVKVD